MRKFLFATALTFVLITTQSCGNKAEQSKSQEAKVVEIPGTTIKLKINDDNFIADVLGRLSKGETTINRKDTIILQIPDFAYKSTEGYVDRVYFSYYKLEDTWADYKTLENKEFDTNSTDYNNYTIIASELPKNEYGAKTTLFQLSAYINNLGMEENSIMSPYHRYCHWIIINEESNTIK